MRARRAPFDHLVWHSDMTCTCGARLGWTQIQAGMARRFDEATWTCARLLLGLEAFVKPSPHAVGKRVG